MNATESTAHLPIERPLGVRYEDIASNRESIFSEHLKPIKAPRQKKEDVAVPQAQHENGTAWQGDETGLGGAIAPSGTGQETKTARKILDAIDADTLRAARVKGGTLPQIEVNRDRIATLLGWRDKWKRPDEIYADEAWEICIIWRSGYGRVEIGTEEDGSVGYYVSRTLSEESKEGNFLEHSQEELDRVMSWLEEAPEEL